MNMFTVLSQLPKGCHRRKDLTLALLTMIDHWKFSTMIHVPHYTQLQMVIMLFVMYMSGYMKL